MSKFVTITTRVKDMECLRGALEDMQIQVADKDSVRGYRGKRRVDFAATTPKGEVGFRKTEDGTFEVVGDDMHVPAGFVDNVTQHYARRKVMKEATRAGFSVVEDKVQRDNSLRLVVRKW